MSLVDNETSEVNLEITFNKNGEMYKHVIRGYELIGIQKDPESGQVAFITKKPTYAESTWNLVQFTNFDLDKLEQMQSEAEAPPEASVGDLNSVRPTI